MGSDAGNCNDESMASENSVVDVIIKPRNNFSSNALRRAVPAVDLRKKKESLTMSMISMGSNGRSQSRLFMSSSNVANGNEDGGRHQSFNTIAKQISFASPRGNEIVKAVRVSSQKMPAAQNANIAEAHSEDESSEKSDPSESDDSESSDSIDAAINGEEETEQSLYDKILAAQEGRET